MTKTMTPKMRGSCFRRKRWTHASRLG